LDIFSIKCQNSSSFITNRLSDRLIHLLLKTIECDADLLQYTKDLVITKTINSQRIDREN